MADDIEKMVLDNQKLVYYFYNKLPQTELCIANKEDIISEGMIGLLKGCKTFDETKGYKVATYLGRCINNAMYMYFRKLNKQPMCVSLDAVVTTDNDGNELTIADTFIMEDDFSAFNINDYTQIYFKYFRTTEKAKQIVETILTMLLDRATQAEIAQQLSISCSYVSRYIKKIREAIIKECSNEQRS